jgi:hypothetical protein
MLIRFIVDLDVRDPELNLQDDYTLETALEHDIREKGWFVDGVVIFERPYIPPPPLPGGDE